MVGRLVLVKDPLALVSPPKLWPRTQYGPLSWGDWLQLFVVAYLFEVQVSHTSMWLVYVG